MRRVCGRRSARRARGAGFQRVFRGAAGPMLLHFCEQADLTAEEIRELEKLLKKKKAKK